MSLCFLSTRCEISNSFNFDLTDFNFRFPTRYSYCPSNLKATAPTLIYRLKIYLLFHSLSLQFKRLLRAVSICGSNRKGYFRLSVHLFKIVHTTWRYHGSKISGSQLQGAYFPHFFLQPFYCILHGPHPRGVLYVCNMNERSWLTCCSSA